jgi:RNA polymerase sigma factor (sigma-70 family)
MPEDMTVEAWDGYICALAHKYKPHNVDLDDAQQEARIAYLEAVNDWDEERGQFKSLLAKRVKWALYRASVAGTELSNGKGGKVKKLFFQVPRVEAELRFQGEPVCDGVIAETLGLPVEEVGMYRAGRIPTRLDDASHEEGVGTLHDKIGWVKSEPENDLDQKRLKAAMDHFREGLGYYERTVYDTRLINPQHWSVCAEELEITRQAVALKEIALREKLRKYAKFHRLHRFHLTG